MSPADVRRADRGRNRVQPDVFAVQLRDGRRPVYPYDIGDLLLVVEVLSPSSMMTDYHLKRDLYVARTVGVWRNGVSPGALFTDVLEWLPTGMDHSLTIDLREFFVTAAS